MRSGLSDGSPAWRLQRSGTTFASLWRIYACGDSGVRARETPILKLPVKRGPCPLLLGPKRGQTQGGVQSMLRPDHRSKERSLWLSGWA